MTWETGHHKKENTMLPVNIVPKVILIYTEGEAGAQGYRLRDVGCTAPLTGNLST